MEHLSAIVVALIMSLPAFLAWRSSQRTRRDVATNHGLRPGEYLELIASDVVELRRQFVTQTAENKKNFDDLRWAIRQLSPEE